MPTKRLAILFLALATVSGPRAALAQAEGEAAGEGEAPAEGEVPAEAPAEGDGEAEGEAPAEGDGEAEPDAYGTGSGGGPDLSFDVPVFGHTTFSMTSTTTARYRGNNYDYNPYDDDFFSLRQRFDIAFQGDELRLEMRLDGFLPFGFSESGTGFGGIAYDRPGWFGSEAVGGIGTMDGHVCPTGRGSQCGLAWDARPERLTLRWEHESWLVEAGDAQIVFGRGVALSFRKVDLLGVDNALRGGHVRYDDGHFRARIHAGIANPQNQDPISLNIIQDPEDIFAAASVGATFGPGDMLTVSGHAVRAWFQDDPMHNSRTQQTVDIAGWTFEAPALADGNLALYVEANGMRRQYVQNEAQSTQTGRAVYASAQLLVENLTILVEWKDYSNFLLSAAPDEPNPYRIYNAAPSLEFDGPQRLRGIGNQRGGSIRLDYGFLPGPWSILVGSSLYGLDDRASYHDPWDGILVSHTWLGFTRRQEYEGDLTWSITANGGYRREQCLVDHCELDIERAGDLDREMVHGQVELTIASGDHGFDLTADHRYEGERIFNGQLTRFQIGGFSLTYTYGVLFSVTFGLRWTDQFAGTVTNRASRDYNFLGSRSPAVVDLSGAGAMYPSIEFRYNFDPSNSIRLFLGQTPGGLICSGGVCRTVPPYEGGLLELVLRL